MIMRNKLCINRIYFHFLACVALWSALTRFLSRVLPAPPFLPLVLPRQGHLAVHEIATMKSFIAIVLLGMLAVAQAQVYPNYVRASLGLRQPLPNTAAIFPGRLLTCMYICLSFGAVFWLFQTS
jgi:hypothetical protein